jgi:pimeloyl-ACP methyl ester carboxylesterase
MTHTTLVFIPCFSGAPWNLKQLTHLQEWDLRTLRLPDQLRDLEQLADYVLSELTDLENYVLVGDSFGAVISIAAAIRQPKGLRGLVLSGGFAKDPITSWVLKGLAAVVHLFPGVFYRELTLRVHAANLRSSFDAAGEIQWSALKTRKLFVHETSHQAYVNRVRAIEHADLSPELRKINVPTLIMTPEEDRLIGRDAADTLRNGIAGSKEVIVERTGHMLRFSHPGRYSLLVRDFLRTV